MYMDLAMPRDIYLPLYGRVEHLEDEDMAWDLCQTPELSRLRDISLACTPSRFVPHGQAASRFQHSVGASVLARRLCELNPELQSAKEVLVAACLLHDSASPPFSHVSEPFLFERTGLHHEQAVAEVLSEGSSPRRVLDDFSISSEAVADTICGRGAYGPLVAGSIDLDNLDNSLHLLISLGYTGRLPYNPLQLVEAIGFEDGEAFISLDDQSFQQLLGWRAARRELYSRLGSLVYLASTSMLYRAVDLVDSSGDLPDSFFSLDETEALAFLESHARARKLIEDLKLWRQYACRMWLFLDEEDPRAATLYGDVSSRRSAADAMADALLVPRTDLCLYVGREKGHRAIDLPFRGPSSLTLAAEQAFAATSPRQQAAVFIDKRHDLSPERVKAAYEEMLSGLPEGPPTHSFF